MILRRHKQLPLSKDFFLSLISGSEAGIATTAAIIAGLVASTDDRQLVTISAMVALIVQAFNSSMTLITTAHTAQEIEEGKRSSVSIALPIAQAGLQFLTHIGASMVALLPIVLVTNLTYALLWSLGLSVLMLFSVGYLVGRTVAHTPIRDGIATAVIGMLVISGGLLAGLILSQSGL